MLDSQRHILLREIEHVEYHRLVAAVLAVVYSPDHLHDSLAFMHDFLVALLVDDGQLALHEYAEIHRRVVVPA